MQRLSFLFVLIILYTPVNAQEMLGLVNGNYSGTNSLLINPGYLTCSKLYLDINLFTTNLFFQNNYLYIDRSEDKIFDILKDPPKSLSSTRQFIHELENDEKKSAFYNLRIYGLSAMLVLGRHSFAISNSIRSAGSIIDVPYMAANLGLFGIADNPLHYRSFEAEEFMLIDLTWEEFNLSYAYILNATGKNQWSIGVTIKNMFGIAGGYFLNNKIDYSVSNDSISININFDGEYAYSLPLDYTDNSFTSDNLYKGYNVGFDFGIYYQKNIKANPYFGVDKIKEQKFNEYNYRIGLSLLDVGCIKFKENAKHYVYNDASTDWQNLNALSFTNLDQYNKDISYAFYSDSNLTLYNNQFSVCLPTAMSIQLDFNLMKNWYLNGIYFQGINLGEICIKRPSQLSVSIRYESKLFAFCIPFSLYEVKSPRIGIAVKVYYLTIGTDKLNNLFNYKSFSGLDFYASVKIPFAKGRKLAKF